MVRRFWFYFPPPGLSDLHLVQCRSECTGPGVVAGPARGRAAQYWQALRSHRRRLDQLLQALELQLLCGLLTPLPQMPSPWRACCIPKGVNLHAAECRTARGWMQTARLA